MSNEELIDALVTKKLVSEATGARLKRDAARGDRTLDAIIWSEHLVDDAKLAQVKSEFLKVPYKKIAPASIDAALFTLLPETTARTYGVIPISKSGGVFVAGMVDPADPRAQEALKFIAKRERLNLGVFLVSYGDWQDALRRYSPYRSDIEAAVQSLRLEPASKRTAVSLEDALGASGEDAPVIRIVASTLREAIEAKASDVHIEPGEYAVRVRFRIDGDLQEASSVPLELGPALISRVKILSNLKIDEIRIPQDGRFRAKVLDREVDFRVATFPTPQGEKVAIRILDSSTGLVGFEKLGLSGKSFEMVEAGLSRPYGMILLTGPTGSGKTTTLYALLSSLNRENVNIVSLEDPVEYFVPGVNQSQVRPEIGYDFASGLRQILRQDPDIIMVGEIRDNETAGLAVQAALTGHIVLSTLHTNNAAGVIPRLIDMKVEPFLLPAALNLMISQRLVGRLCPDCKKEAELPRALQDVIRRTLDDVPPELKSKYREPYRVFRGAGCATCKGRGSIGRVALFEVLRMTPELADIATTGANIQKILKEQKNQKMLSLREDGVLKALEGTVSLEQVIQETEEV